MSAEPAPPRLDLRAGLREALAPLAPSDRRKLVLATAAMSTTALLDLLGVVLLASVVALLTAAVSPDAQASLAASPLGAVVDGRPTLAVAVGAALVATLALVAKSLVSWAINRKVLLFVGAREADIGSSILRRVNHAPFPQAQALAPQLVINAVLVGSRAMTQLLYGVMSMTAEGVLVVGLSLLLLVASPALFLFAVVYFGLLSLGISRLVGGRSHAASAAATATNLAAAAALQDAAGLGRELRIYGLTEAHGGQIARAQLASARAAASQQAWLQAPRYLLEAALILGLCLAGGVALVTQTPERAAFSLGLYAVASSRLLPSIQRINGAWGAVQSSLGQLMALGPIRQLDGSPSVAGTLHSAEPTTAATSPGATSDLVGGVLRIRDVSYTYPGSGRSALRGVSLDIPTPGRVAFVGASGAGKSTLADLVLGLIEPTEGFVGVQSPSGEQSTRAAVPWRAGFVAQDGFILGTEVRTNVSLALPGEDVDDEAVWAALERARAADFVRRLPLGLDSPLGDRGSRLSGGQRQRIALARALYRQPEVLVLDEATSALDAHTERAVTSVIDRLAREVTVITIAHRLATIRDADLVCYLADGALVDVGTFDELVSRHVDFASSARLQGIGALAESWDPIADGRRNSGSGV